MPAAYRCALAGAGRGQVLGPGAERLDVALAAGYFRCYYASPTAELRYPWALFRLFRRGSARSAPLHTAS